MTSDPMVASGTENAGRCAWPASTGTISNPWKVKAATSAAAPHEGSGPARAREAPRRGGRAGETRNTRASAISGTSFSAVSAVQVRADSREAPRAEQREERGEHGRRRALRRRPLEADHGPTAVVSPTDHRGRAGDRAHVGDPAHDEGGQGAKGGPREDHRPAILVEPPAEGGESQGHRDQRQAR